MAGKMSFVLEMLKNGFNGALNPKVDEVRSQYPALLASGYWAWGAGSTVKSSILGVTSTGQRFYLGNIMINNDDDVPNRVLFFDGPGVSVPVIPIQVPKSATVFIDNIKGCVFQSGVHASLLTSLTQIRVGGLIASS